MRDIERIDKILEAVGKEWKKVPDWRFGQLLCNLQRFVNNDMFYVEDEDFVKVLQKYFSDVDD